MEDLPDRDDIDASEVMKNRDLANGCEKSLVNFFSERIPCNCLDGRLKEVKGLSKTGICGGCGKREHSSRLKVCTRCKTQQYCSKACQVSNWPIHKVMCKKIGDGSIRKDQEKRHEELREMLESKLFLA